MNSIMHYCVILLICIAITAYIFIFAAKYRKKGKVRFYYMNFVLSVFGQCLFDLIWKLSEGKVIRLNGIFSYTVNIMYFVCATLMSYFWFLYSEKVQASKKTKMERTISLILLNVPYAFIMILIGTTCFTRKVFYIQNGLYHRGDLYILTVIIPAVYVVYTSVKALLRLTNKKYYTRRIVNLFISLYAIVLLVFQTIQIITNAEIPAAEIGSVIIAFISHEVYMYLRISLDSVTHLDNRYTFELELQKRLYEGTGSKIFIAMFMVHELKNIEKLYGYEEKDRALIKCSEVLKATLPQGFELAKFSNSKFAVIGEYEKLTDMSSYCEKVSESLREFNNTHELKYNLYMSFGYSAKSSNTTFIIDMINDAEQQALLSKEYNERA
ncbi:MAG: GGDEF domain-containing protein [Clostridia bacterium]|nr:GGDEF domain-containing protein [Clostridia bacterium]